MFWIVLAHFNFNIFGMFIYVASSPDPFFGSPKIHLQLGSVFLVVQENRRSCAILATELGNLGISLPKQKGGSRMGFSTTKMEGLGSLQSSKR